MEIDSEFRRKAKKICIGQNLSSWFKSFDELGLARFHRGNGAGYWIWHALYAAKMLWKEGADYYH